MFTLLSYPDLTGYKTVVCLGYIKGTGDPAVLTVVKKIINVRLEENIAVGTYLSRYVAWINKEGWVSHGTPMFG